MPLAAFNGDARRSLEHQTRVISADNMTFLQSLPESSKVCGEVTLAHGSPRDPIWEYILNTLSARLNFDYFDTPFCFVGHAHLQCMFQLDEEKNRISMEQTKVGEIVTMTPRAIFNPGSVGQPRDGDARAAFAIADTDRKLVTLYRVAYPIEAAQKKILEAGLPPMLAYRLGMGR